MSKEMIELAEVKQKTYGGEEAIVDVVVEVSC